MKILVTGANGQLGMSFRALAGKHGNIQFSFFDLPELDLNLFPETEALLRAEKPDVVINCAAYTAVDKAEQEREAAWALNHLAVAHLAQLCQQTGSFLIHVSTDYVFDGTSCHPYTETDSCSPVSVYGASKREGELEVLMSNAKALIVRTSWLYSEYGHNFVKTMLRLAKERSEVRVVCDQIGGPTYAGDLAEAIMKCIPGLSKLSTVEVLHFANAGVASWYDLALSIFELSGLNCKVIPISTEEYPTPARRPAYSVFNTAKIRAFIQDDIPHWRDALGRCLANMKENA